MLARKKLFSLPVPNQLAMEAILMPIPKSLIALFLQEFSISASSLVGLTFWKRRFSSASMSTIISCFGWAVSSVLMYRAPVLGIFEVEEKQARMQAGRQMNFGPFSITANEWEAGRQF
nr:hypothetical protein Iba_scaffold208437CG0010 [Ipomoea batatas]GME04249.1 hypothetical protein Iba_scaffold1717CG0160 [Ipomoea batatas]